jgi:hypothetical protein
VPLCPPAAVFQKKKKTELSQPRNTEARRARTVGARQSNAQHRCRPSVAACNPPPTSISRSATWENESATNPEGIGSSSPDLPVSPSISSMATSVGGSIGSVARLGLYHSGEESHGKRKPRAQGLAQGWGGGRTKCFFCVMDGNCRQLIYNFMRKFKLAIREASFLLLQKNL